MLLFACAVPPEPPDAPDATVTGDTATDTGADTADTGGDTGEDTDSGDTAIVVTPIAAPCPEDTAAANPDDLVPTTSLCFEGSYAGHGLAAEDVDGDGHRDLLVGTGSQNMLFIFYEDLPAGTPDAAAISTIVVGELYGAVGVGIAVADLDQDGRVDLALGDPEIGGYFDDGAVSLRTLTPEARIADPWAHYNAEAQFLEMGTGLDVGDLDGDGALDLVVGSRPTHPASHVWIGFGPFGPIDGTSDDFDLDLTYEEDGYGACGQYPHILGDTDGDGADDLLIGGGLVGENQGRLWVAAGPFAPGDGLIADFGASFTGEEGWYAGEARAAPGDLDGDGYADFVAGADGVPGVDGSDYAGAAYVWFGPFADGDHAMADAPVQFVGDDRGDRCGTQLAVGDLDQDGQMDLALSCSTYTADPLNQVALYSNPFAMPRFTLEDADTVLASEGSDFGDELHITEDVTGDGAPELFVSTSRAEPSRLDLFSGWPGR